MKPGQYVTAILAVCLIAVRPLDAQTIRGTVEDTLGMPLHDVIVGVLESGRDSVLRTVRSGTSGEFTINTGTSGTFRLRLNRIGYAQQTSDPINLQAGQIVTVRFKMTAVAQRIAPMEVIERRKITLDEIMSSSGFDLRQSKYPMNSLDADRLAMEGNASAELIFRDRMLMGVTIIDTEMGPTIAIERPSGTCYPEVYLDGLLLADTNANQAAHAFAVIAGYSASQLYGVEVYRGAQIPPPSLGGMFGSYTSSRRPCGVVAVWTKAAREMRIIAERARAAGSMQVLRGKVVDFDTGLPIPGVSLTLQSEGGKEVERPVVTDSAGMFSIRTYQFGRLRLAATPLEHVPLVTPPVEMELEEMMTVEVILSKRHTPVAPIGLRRREFPQSYPATSFLGFDYRRRRGTGGVFYDAQDIARSGAASLEELLRRVPGAAAGSGPQSPIALKRVAPADQRQEQAPGSTTCTPMYFLNGELEREPETRILPVALARLQGVEVYATAAEVPFNYRMGSTGCGAIGVWTK